MSTFSSKSVPHWSRVFPCIALLLTADGLNPTLQADVVAGNTNRISPIWAAVYGAQDLEPNADPDGDGVATWLEAIAGTDPFEAQSTPRLSVFAVTNRTAQAAILG